MFVFKEKKKKRSQIRFCNLKLITTTIKVYLLNNIIDMTSKRNRVKVHSLNGVVDMASNFMTHKINVFIFK